MVSKGMKIQDAVIEFKDTGCIIINVDKIIKNWSLLWRIYQHENEYVLTSLTPKGKRVFKTRISEGDAKEIIRILSLYFVRDTIFKQYGKWLAV